MLNMPQIQDIRDMARNRSVADIARSLSVDEKTMPNAKNVSVISREIKANNTEDRRYQAISSLLGEFSVGETKETKSHTTPDPRFSDPELH